MSAHMHDKSALAYTERTRGEFGAPAIPRLSPDALCAGMHAKIGDICLSIFKQWRTLHRSNISNGDIIDMHKNLCKKNISEQTKKGIAKKR